MLMLEYFICVDQRQTRSEFPFRAQDLQVLENCSVILAAEGNTIN